MMVNGQRGCGGLGAGLGAALGVGWPYALQEADMMSSMAVNAASPGGSWSSGGTASNTASDCCGSNDCCLNGCHGDHSVDHAAEDADRGSSKRSSAALSGCSDESASRESPVVGTDFTRDFYRLVKFESTKSLASSSSRNSRGHGCGEANININNNNNLPASLDREQALQSVLKFIAEQQKYCHSREEQDSATEVNSRPTSYNMEDEPRSLSAYSEGSADLNATENEHPSLPLDDQTAAPREDDAREQPAKEAVDTSANIFDNCEESTRAEDDTCAPW